MVERRRWLDVMSYVDRVRRHRARRLPGLPGADRLDAHGRSGRSRADVVGAGRPDDRELPPGAVRGRRRRLARAGRPHDAGEPDDGGRHRGRQDPDLAAVGVRDRLLPLPAALLLLLDDLRHADAAGRGAHHADLPGDVRPRTAQHVSRADHAADRVGDGDFPVPPVLHDGARRTGRGRPHRRRGADALLLHDPRRRCRSRTSRRCS